MLSADIRTKYSSTDMPRCLAWTVDVMSCERCVRAAPLLALINNITEIRGDAYKLCRGFRRPEWRVCEDIGSWHVVLQVRNKYGLLAHIWTHEIMRSVWTHCQLTAQSGWSYQRMW